MGETAAREAKVEEQSGERCPRVGFVVTNLSCSHERVTKFYQGRDTAEQWIKEGKKRHQRDAPMLP